MMGSASAADDEAISTAVQRGVPGVEDRGEPDAETRRRPRPPATARSTAAGAAERCARSRMGTWVPTTNITRAKPMLASSSNVGSVWSTRPKPVLAQHDSGHQLADDDRETQPGHRRPAADPPADDDEQGQRAEPDVRHLSPWHLPGHQPARDGGVLVGQIAGADPVVPVGDLQRHAVEHLAAHQQHRRKLLARVDLREVGLDARVRRGQQRPGGRPAGRPWPCAVWRRAARSASTVAATASASLIRLR